MKTHGSFLLVTIVQVPVLHFSEKKIRNHEHQSLHKYFFVILMLFFVSHFILPRCFIVSKLRAQQISHVVLDHTFRLHFVKYSLHQKYLKRILYHETILQ
jgi:uncharacterized membrane protein